MNAGFFHMKDDISLLISLRLLSLDICVDVPKTESFTSHDLLVS